MTKLNAWKMAWNVLLLFAVTPIASSAQVFNTLVNFDDANGANPVYAPLFQGVDGDLYGTTEYGGNGNCSNTYGIGCGIVFKFTAKSTRTTSHSFLNAAEGKYPLSGVIQATDGNFYGTTYGGGAYNYGTIFRVSQSGALWTLHAFDYTDGAYPFVNLIQGNDGNFYGATGSGGPNLWGTVFKITPSGTLTTLHAFNLDDGSYPNALVEASDGNLYGTTFYGGSEGGGIVFRITPTGTLTTLYVFCSQPRCSDGAVPSGTLVEAPDGNLWRWAAMAISTEQLLAVEISALFILAVAHCSG